MSSQKNYREKFIRAFRIALAQKGWTQAQLAQHINKTPQYISVLMVGKRNPKEELQIEIAQAFGYNLDDFIKLGDKGGESPVPGILPDREKELLKKIEALSDLVVDLERQLKEANKAPEKIIRGFQLSKDEHEALKRGYLNISVVPAVPGGELETE